MLAQRFIAMCDHASGCKARCKALVTLETAPVAKGVMEPIVLRPNRIELADGWKMGWNGTFTGVYCPKHKVPR